MKKIISLYGPPGAGKTTQAEILVQKHGFSLFGMGERLRAEVASASLLGVAIKPYLDEGTLIPDKYMAEIIKEAEKMSSAVGLIFDGFPRMISQADMLNSILNSLNLKVNAFVLLDLKEEEALKRIKARAHLSETKRSDDTDENALRNRFAIFNKESITLSQYYTNRNLFTKIDGAKSIEDIHQELVKILGL